MFSRRWVLALVVMLLGDARVMAQEASSSSTQLAQSFSRLTWHELDNGMLVVLDPNPELATVTVAVSVAVGQRDVPVGWSGLVHLAEHLLFRPRSESDVHFIDRLERLGVVAVNGVTSRDRTVFFETVPAAALDEVLWLEADRFTQTLPALDANAIRTEREIVHRERSLRDDASTLAPLLVHRILYGQTHPYVDALVERAEDLEAIGLPEMQVFMQRAYTPERMTIAISGNFDPPRTMQRITELFGGMQRSAHPWPIPTVSVPEVHGERRLLVDVPRAHDALMVIWPTAPYGSAEDAALDLIARTLEERLRRRLIERGRGYEVSVAQRSADIASEFIVTIEVPRRSGTLIPLEALDAELRILHGEPLDEEDLTRAKHEFHRRWLLALDSTQDRALLFSRRPIAFLNQRFDPNADLARYQTLDARMLQQTSRISLRRDARLVVSLDARPGVPYEGVLVRDLVVDESVQ